MSLCNPSKPTERQRHSEAPLGRRRTARDGRQYLGRRVDAHWKDGQAGWVDAVEVIAITDADVRDEALRDGFVDIAETGEGLGKGDHVGQPRVVSDRARFDDGRIAERWWIA